jgi:hypothetical protein
LATTTSLLNPSLLAQLFLGAEIIIHPEQLLNLTTLVDQLEVVIVDIQAGKEEGDVERTQLRDVPFSTIHLGFTLLEILKE